MKLYKIMIEGVFVILPDIGVTEGGFYSTFFVRANNARSAIDRSRSMLEEKMKSHGVGLSSSSWSRSHFVVDEICEISSDKFEEGSKEGFTFFPLSRLERLRSIARFWLLRMRKSDLLIEASAAPV